MAQRIFHSSGWTAAPLADTTNLTTLQYMALKGGSATQRINVTEIQVGGLASTTSPSIMQWARASTLEAGAASALTATAPNASDGPKDASTAALAAPPVAFQSAA